MSPKKVPYTPLVIKSMADKKTPTVECQMMIRKPVSVVFQAFIDPEITTKFWFTNPVNLKKVKPSTGHGRCTG